MKARSLLFILLLFAVLAACTPAASPTTAPQPSAATATLPSQKATQKTEPSFAPQATATPASASVYATATRVAATPAEPLRTEVSRATQTAPVIVEGRTVELEWPSSIRLGDSDVVRLSLLPAQAGYNAQVEFPDHSVQTRDVSVPRPEGYDLYAVARLDGVDFDISPQGELARLLPPAEEASWRWTLSPRSAGKHTLAIQLLLRWTPTSTGLPLRESQAFGRGIQVEVRSFLGLNPVQAGAFGVIGLLLGGSLCLVAAVFPRRQGGGTGVEAAGPAGGLQVVSPGGSLSVECPPGMSLTAEEAGLLRALFEGYARLVIEREFLSGYSGARTFLVRPIRADLMADAAAIVKLGAREAIRQEWQNYESFVSRRLPPVTARIQRAPVTLKSGARAAVQYTFIAEPGRLPSSLRQALLDDPDPALLLKLFETFGSAWWMQRRPYTFRLGQEYDCLLPPHLALAPAEAAPGQAGAGEIGTHTDPSALKLESGERVRLQPFPYAERRADGSSLTLTGMPTPGRAPLRLRWLSPRMPARGELAQVVSTRAQLLHELAAPFDLLGEPDPLLKLDALLEETIAGTRSVIHGDLNLENALVGPGNLVWLIDFAQTREGHPLFDFAHLESEIIAHILAPRTGSPQAYLHLWRSGTDPLLEAVHAMARRCLFDPAREREYRLALFMACLGALKYGNLGAKEKQCLFVTAADIGRQLDA